MVQTENQSKNGITIKHHKSKEVYAWNPSIGARKCNKDFEIDECLKKWACIVSLIIQKLRVMQYQIHHRLCQLMLLKKKQHLKWIFTFFTLFCYEFATLLALCSHVPYAPCFLSATVPHVFCALFSLALQVPCALHDLVPHVFRVLHAIVLCVPRILINHVFFFITRACLSVILVP